VTDEAGEEAECFECGEAAAAVVPALRWAAGDGDEVVAGESPEELVGPAGDPLGEDDEGEAEEGEPDRFGVLTSRLVPDGRVTDGVGTVTDGVGTVTDGVLEGVVTDGVLTTGAEIFGVVAVGVVTEGVLTVGAEPTGVVTCGVVTDGTVTDGTVTDGTVTCGVLTAGSLAAGVLTVGRATLGRVAAVPASGWLISRAKPAATAAKEQILRMPLKRSGVVKLAHSGTNCRRKES
jgi:X-X-X-Leu-X-X-Gly heptad repeat protein